MNQQNPDPHHDAVVAVGNLIYERLREAGVTVPAEFQGYRLAREIVELLPRE
jgi:hypothetical protein